MLNIDHTEAEEDIYGEEDINGLSSINQEVKVLPPTQLDYDNEEDKTTENVETYNTMIPTIEDITDSGNDEPTTYLESEDVYTEAMTDPTFSETTYETAPDNDLPITTAGPVPEKHVMPVKLMEDLEASEIDFENNLHEEENLLEPTSFFDQIANIEQKEENILGNYKKLEEEWRKSEVDETTMEFDLKHDNSATGINSRPDDLSNTILDLPSSIKETELNTLNFGTKDALFEPSTADDNLINDTDGRTDYLKRDTIFLPAGHGLLFGFKLGNMFKQDKLKLDLFSSKPPFDPTL